MKKMLYLFFALLFIAKTSYSQTKEERSFLQEVQTFQVANYELIPTKNMWVFLRLDTRNGKINQVHFSIDRESYRGEFVVNDETLLPWREAGEEKPGRFTLYPTQNTYNFILLDRIDGRSWLIQWSLDKEKRFIIPI